MKRDMLTEPEETESGSAGTQLGKGYSGLRCAKALQVSGGFPSPGTVFIWPIGHRSHALINPTANLREANDLRKKDATTG